MKRILLSILLIAAVSTAVASTGAWLVDTETSNGNVFTGALVDLRVDGGDVNVVKFSIPKMVPGNQPTGGWLIENAGNIPGYLDIHDIVVTEYENGLTEPESEAGDTTDAVGELGEIVNLRLYVDGNKNGSWDGAPTDTMLFSGDVHDIASAYDSSVVIPAGGSTRITACFDWWSENDSAVPDSRAMTDGLDLGMRFQLGQTAAQ